MRLQIFVVASALVGLGFLALAVQRLRRRRFVAGTLSGLSGGVLLLGAACAGLVGANLLTYERLTYEQPALELQLQQQGDRAFACLLTYPSGKTQRVALAGDEWQVDARVLKMRGFANIVGFDAAYRLERISGRYRDIASERAANRTVYALSEERSIDVWELARRYKEWLPWVDALYGSATYLPMADGALYEVRVSQSGLTARPLNQAARQAVGGWR